ncbi:MAG: ABC transporter permease [Gemmatimonadaceae bacterium]
MLHVPRTALRVGTEALRVNPLRTALSTVGVIIGVAALVAVLSLGDGMERTAREQVLSTSNLQSIAVRSRTGEAVDGDVFPLADTLAIEARDAEAIAALPGVATFALTVQARLEVRAVGSDLRRMAMVRGTRGVDELPAELAAGRVLAPADSSGGAAVLAYAVARRLDANGNASAMLGRHVVIREDTLEVVGVLAEQKGAPVSAVLVPYRTAVQSARRGRVLPEMIVQANRIEDVAPVQAGIERVLGLRSPSWRTYFEVATYRARADQLAQGILIFKLLMGAITGISLLVGGIGIMNVLLASVSERTREIGIRRATGATRRDIRLQFLAESVAISGFGSVLGIVLGLGGAFAITAAIRSVATAGFVRASFTWGSVLAAAIASLMIGLLFGTYPAHRAAQLSPIDAIRHE